jgi:hypothetical protein
VLDESQLTDLAYQDDSPDHLWLQSVSAHPPTTRQYRLVTPKGLGGDPEYHARVAAAEKAALAAVMGQWTRDQQGAFEP